MSIVPLYSILHLFSDGCLIVAGAGCAYLLLAIILSRRFVMERNPLITEPVPVTILKPLHGDEPGLLKRLSRFCSQDYAGPVQIVFGCQDCRDQAIGAVQRLQMAQPELVIDLVIGGPSHGSNQKVSNLINMAAAARYDVLVIADSDIEVGPCYLADVIAALERPGVGAVTCFYHGVARDSLPASFSALTINAHFLPNVLVAIGLGLARPCFGATIALRREMLDKIGSLRAFAHTLADDHAIGVAVRAAGYEVAIPAFSVGHACHEQTFREFFGRHLRYARTIKRINPVGYAGAIVTNPMPLALFGMLAGNNSLLLLVAAAIACRIALCKSIEETMHLPRQQRWLLPVTDIALFAVFVLSFFGSSVTWRGHHYRVRPDGTLFQDPVEGNGTRSSG
ncbi:MAG TPA: bacteriohopanetetrol glucosamine biosynthesis glycosyltransferase HpnI [Methylocella sp.]|nr:bacteriohopanetetrol glucosamine biosynthesis glycosyltransferase HpnI [Methylocella sp.]